MTRFLFHKLAEQNTNKGELGNEVGLTLIEHFVVALHVKLIVIGLACSAPITFYVMNQWLSDFAYKITIGPAIFLIGLALTFFIAIITVGYRSLRAATVNPVDSLRSE